MTVLARWLGTAVFGGVGLFVVSINWFRHWAMYREAKAGRRKFISGLPFFGPLLITAGLFLCPVSVWSERAKWAWVPWLLDEQTWMLAIVLIALPFPWARRELWPPRDDGSAH